MNFSNHNPLPQRGTRRLEWWEIRQLEKQGCKSESWDKVLLHEESSLDLLRRVRFNGDISIGRLLPSDGGKTGIYDAVLENCLIGDDVFISKIGVGIKNAIIGNRARIENVGRIEYDDESHCGLCTEVSVLDETGTRPVWIYPGLSAQTAMLMARKPAWAERLIKPEIHDIKTLTDVWRGIGDDAVVTDTITIRNVSVGSEVNIEGAKRLENGMIVNNAGIRGRSLANVGHGVDAKNFIVEDATVSGAAYLRNVYVGQGAVVHKRFTAQDSLVFSDSVLESGEATSVFAGPYTVSKHKSSLLIGASTSFLNAGSGTNLSNHLYRLGPVHWGILERGVKTASGSYVMWGARIGAFSLVMGSHHNHPDSSDLPFSYLFGDEKGATTVVPGRMLRSCGLMRDELKWSNRDLRQKRKLKMHDRVDFAVFNPYTVGKMLDAIDILTSLLARQSDDDLYVRYKGMKMRPSHIELGIKLYTLAIMKYLSAKVGEDGRIPASDGKPAEEWIDLGGQIMPRSVMEKALKSDSIDDIEEIFDNAFDCAEEMEVSWIGRRFDESWRNREGEIAAAAAQFDQMVEEDRLAYRDSVVNETKMLEL